MPAAPAKPQRKPSWLRTVLRLLVICGGAVGILLPAWLPDRPDVPVETGTVELLQAALLAGASVMMFGAMPHAGAYRAVCRLLGLGFFAAFTGEMEDFITGILGWKFPEAVAIGGIVAVMLVTVIRHRMIMVHFLATLGNHAGTGFIASALLIIYVFNRVIGGPTFWKATLGDKFTHEIPKICESYLELLACYLIFIGALGLSITLARRRDIH